MHLALHTSHLHPIYTDINKKYNYAFPVDSFGSDKTKSGDSNWSIMHRYMQRRLMTKLFGRIDLRERYVFALIETEAILTQWQLASIILIAVFPTMSTNSPFVMTNSASVAIMSTLLSMTINDII